MKKLACVLALLSGLGCSRARPLTVGSKNFTEQIVLGAIVAQQLERRLGGKVDRKLDLGGTLLAQQALRNGEIDLYPEYTGTALTAGLKLAPLSDPAAVLERVRAEYRKRWRLEWLDPLGFDNTFAMVVRGPDARARRGGARARRLARAGAGGVASWVCFQQLFGGGGAPPRRARPGDRNPDRC